MTDSAEYYYLDVWASDMVRLQRQPYRRRELWIRFKGKFILHGWCHAEHLAGIFEPEHPWGFYQRPTQKP